MYPHPDLISAMASERAAELLEHVEDERAAEQTERLEPARPSHRVPVAWWPHLRRDSC